MKDLSSNVKKRLIRSYSKESKLFRSLEPIINTDRRTLEEDRNLWIRFARLNYNLIKQLSNCIELTKYKNI